MNALWGGLVVGWGGIEDKERRDPQVSNLYLSVARQHFTRSIATGSRVVVYNLFGFNVCGKFQSFEQHVCSNTLA